MNFERKHFVHCPAPDCDEPLKGSWSDYLTDEKHPTTGLPVYKCPNCGLRFTVDSFSTNAIPVPGDNTDIVLYDTASRKVLDIISRRFKFTDGTHHYVHLPLKLCLQKHIRCFAFEAKDRTYAEIAELCEEAIKNNVEVMR